MIVSFSFSSLKGLHWYEFGLRVLFGGLTTVAAGLIARVYGPSYGGLFLAFPAIFPASATLLAKKVRQKKRDAGLKGDDRGRGAAGLEARGTGFGSLGLAMFALIVWRLLPTEGAVAALLVATSAWLVSAVATWRWCGRVRRRLRRAR